MRSNRIAIGPSQFVHSGFPEPVAAHILVARRSPGARPTPACWPCSKEESVPLSEHEQRLLEQMERALYAEDPKFASSLRGKDPRSNFRRRVLMASVGFIVGVVLLMTGLVAQDIAGQRDRLRRDAGVRVLRADELPRRDDRAQLGVVEGGAVRKPRPGPQGPQRPRPARPHGAAGGALEPPSRRTAADLLRRSLRSLTASSVDAAERPAERSRRGLTRGQPRGPRRPARPRTAPTSRSTPTWSTAAAGAPATGPTGRRSRRGAASTSTSARRSPTSPGITGA